MSAKLPTWLPPATVQRFWHLSQQKRSAKQLRPSENIKHPKNKGGQQNAVYHYRNCHCVSNCNLGDQHHQQFHPQGNQDCTALVSVVIPSGVTQIGCGTFSNCTSLKNVYYCGSSAQWSAVTIDSRFNTPLTNATVYYYSETKPATAGNYWHYDTDGVTPVKW